MVGKTRYVHLHVHNIQYFIHTTYMPAMLKERIYKHTPKAKSIGILLLEQAICGMDIK